MAELKYNGVSIAYLMHRDVEFRDVMTDDGMDYRHTDATLDVTGFVFSDAKNRAAANFNAIQHSLEEVRGDLVYSVGGVAIIKADDSTDVMNGPFPQVTHIHRIDGVDAFLVGFRVKTSFIKCDKQVLKLGGGDPRFLQVVSNRWREQETLDSDMLGRVTRTGKLIIRGGTGRLDADQFRDVVTPPIPRGFRRAQAVYIVQEDGLALSYVVEDVEMFRQPPAPAVNWSGEYIETRPYPGAMRWGQVNLTLTGGPGTPQSELMRAALGIAWGRLNAEKVNRAKNSGTAVELTMRASLDKNTVSIAVRTQLQPQTNALSASGSVVGGALNQGKGQPWRLDLSNYDLNYSDPEPPFFSLRSRNGLLLAAAILNDPCLGLWANGAFPRDATLSGGGGQSTLQGGKAAAGPGILQGGGGTKSAKPGAGQGGTGSTGGLVDASPATPGMSGGPVNASPAGSGDTPPMATLYVAQTAPGVDDLFQILKPSSPTGGIYTYYRVVPRFKRDTGRVMMPGTLAKGAVAFPQLHQPTTKLLVEWVAEREGEPPAIPDPNLTGAAGPVLLDEEISPEQIEELPGGAIRYTVAGAYTYGFQYPDKVSYNAAVPPWVSDLELAGSASGGSAIQSALASLAAAAAANTSTAILSVDAPGQSSLNGTGPTVKPVPNA
jgi:hypothetical protein